MIEPTDEMVAAAEEFVAPLEESDDTGKAIAAVLAIVERDYRLHPYCNAELMPGVACKHPRTSSPRHKHEAILPATGNRVEWS